MIVVHICCAVAVVAYVLALAMIGARYDEACACPYDCPEHPTEGDDTP